MSTKGYLLFIGLNVYSQILHHHLVSLTNGRKETVIYSFKIKGVKKEVGMKNHTIVKTTVL